jgi:hypothetical protein
VSGGAVPALVDRSRINIASTRGSNYIIQFLPTLVRALPCWISLRATIQSFELDLIEKWVDSIEFVSGYELQFKLNGHVFLTEILEQLMKC